MITDESCASRAIADRIGSRKGEEQLLYSDRPTVTLTPRLRAAGGRDAATASGRAVGG